VRPLGLKRLQQLKKGSKATNFLKTARGHPCVVNRASIIKASVLQCKRAETSDSR
jgi:hypothetical protein